MEFNVSCPECGNFVQIQKGDPVVCPKCGEVDIDTSPMDFGVWQETATHELDDRDCLYLAKDKGVVYKLQKACAADSNKPFYFWAGLALTDSVGYPRVMHEEGPDELLTEFDSLQDAIQAALEDDWLVRRVQLSEVFKSPFE